MPSRGERFGGLSGENDASNISCLLQRARLLQHPRFGRGEIGLFRTHAFGERFHRVRVSSEFPLELDEPALIARARLVDAL